MVKVFARSVLSVALGIVASPPGVALADCATDLVGIWRQTRIDYGGYPVDDNSQSWEFKADGTVRFVKIKPAIDVTGGYTCAGEIITTESVVSGKLRIVDLGAGNMAFEMLDKGGGLAHVTKAR